MVDGNLAGEERLAWLTEQLQQRGSLTITAAAEELGVSEMTVRRDLVELEERGTARRVRGGALPVGPRTFAERHQTRARAKGQIAAKLVALVPPSGIVAFDASSTVMRLTQTFAGERDLTVVTNGPDTFAALQGRPGITPILTGGQLELRTGSLVGPIACRSAAQLTVRRFITSAAALAPEVGATETTLDEAEIKRVMAAGADEVVLAVDSSKLDQRAVAVGLDWDRIDVLVTELDPDDPRLTPYRTLTTLL